MAAALQNCSIFCQGLEYTILKSITCREDDVHPSFVYHSHFAHNLYLLLSNGFLLDLRTEHCSLQTYPSSFATCISRCTSTRRRRRLRRPQSWLRCAGYCNQVMSLAVTHFMMPKPPTVQYFASSIKGLALVLKTMLNSRQSHNFKAA